MQRLASRLNQRIASEERSRSPTPRSSLSPSPLVRSPFRALLFSASNGFVQCPMLSYTGICNGCDHTLKPAKCFLVQACRLSTGHDEAVRPDAMRHVQKLAKDYEKQLQQLQSPGSTDRVQICLPRIASIDHLSTPSVCRHVVRLACPATRNCSDLSQEVLQRIRLVHCITFASLCRVCRGRPPPSKRTLASSMPWLLSRTRPRYALHLHAHADVAPPVSPLSKKLLLPPTQSRIGREWAGSICVHVRMEVQVRPTTRRKHCMLPPRSRRAESQGHLDSCRSRLRRKLI